MTIEATSAQFEHRYDAIDVANKNSFYMTDSDRPFTVAVSVHSIGQPREKIIPDVQLPEEVAERRRRNTASISDETNRAARFILAGNMSTIVRDGKAAFGPEAMTSDERLADARENMNTHLKNLGIDPAAVRILNPDRDYSTPLVAVNVDEDPTTYDGVEPARLEGQGDFLYTYNPDIVLAARPADCPIAIMTAETPRGRVHMLLHFAWKGPASGQYDDMQREFDALEIDHESLRVYITPGGHAETFRYKGYVPDGEKNPQIEEGRLFVGITDEATMGDQKKYSFGIDTPHDVYQAFIDMGLDPKQLFLDTTDTTALDAGHGSNSRAINQLEDNVRDLVTAQFN